MELRQDTQSQDKSSKTDRPTPQPLADRRRLLRTPAKPAKPAQVFTDWASI